MAHLTLTNDLTNRMRHGLHKSQRGTILDQTWLDLSLVFNWRCEPGPMGSDHCPSGCCSQQAAELGGHAQLTSSTGTPSGRQ